MAKYTRGEFLGFGAALAGGFAVGRTAVGAAAPLQPAPSTNGAEPDLAVVNARVFTSDPALPRA